MHLVKLSASAIRDLQAFKKSGIDVSRLHGELETQMRQAMTSGHFHTTGGGLFHLRLLGRYRAVVRKRENTCEVLRIVDLWQQE